MKIVIAGRADAADVEQLRREHPQLELVQAPREHLAQAIADADAVYAHGLTSEQFAGATRLRWVQSQGAGVEWIARCPEVIESGVTVTNTREHAWRARPDHQMKPGAHLLVMSRGGTVDEEAVAEALRSGKLSGAGMDVFGQEPLQAESPLWDAPNAILPPHTSGSSRQTVALAWSIVAENVGRFVRGEPLDNVVDKRRGY
jgi:phosphoglycerate dehydrogenase-like enzyme